MTEKELRLKTAAAEKKNHLSYFNIAVSVDCVLFSYHEKKIKVLLIKSDLKEFENLYSLLGDLVKPDEDLEAASYRILKQRTGLDDIFLEQVKTFGSLTRHPSGRVITVAYYSLVDIKHNKLKLGNNELSWHTLTDIKKLAFDHKQILNESIKKLREQALVSPVVCNLLPEKFSLRELQELYEAIFGNILDRRNFRKKIAAKDWLTDIGEMETKSSRRPGKLYSVKKENRKKQGK